MSRADAIVVLGCTVSQKGDASVALRRRLTLGARAFRQGVSPIIIVSGGRRWGTNIEAVVMRRELVAMGLPASAITMELCSLSTAENCLFTAEILSQRALSSVLVATCAWHYPRAARNFRRVGIRPVAPPTSWMRTPPASWTRRIRERVNVVSDWCMMPRARHV